jgi:A/G-specific adenine glycosylase
VPLSSVREVKRDIAILHKDLISWYSENKRDLPWRKTADAYHIWVSEVMLQQTQVNTVLPYYQKFLERFPDLKHLARANLQAVLKIWEGMGYYARARHLHQAAGIVLNHHGGIVPATWAAFRKLPGVGDYIAAAVLSIAFGKPYAVVDGNVKRVLSRLLMLAEAVNQSTSSKVFTEAADKLLDPENPGTFNQAMMELGALVCKPQHPLCNICPLIRACLAYQSGQVCEYPKKIKKRSTPEYHIAVGVVFKKDRVLVTRRKPEGLLGGLWEFPGGKILAGETAAAACVREIREEVNLTVQVDSFLTQVKHAYTHFKIIMEVFCCSYIRGRVKLNGPEDFRWLSLQKLDEYPFPKANHKFMGKLKQMCNSRHALANPSNR